MAVEHGAAGKVTTGFSFPYVAKYTASAGSITFTGGMELARGVDVSFDIDEPGDNNYYANNQLAESGPSRFTNGNINLTVDGLLAAAERFIMGLPEADDQGWTAHGDAAEVPYVGIGFIVRFMSGGVESWTPYVVPKTKFNPISIAAATQEEEIDWQSQSLTAKVFRADNADHDWLLTGSDYATEAEALTALKTKLGITA